MTPERYQRIGELFDAVLERAPAERTAFLAHSCEGDVELRQAVEKLLAHHEDSEEFLSRPALHVAAVMLADRQDGAVIGQQIRQYQVLSLLGAGGMGQVYLAQDTRLGRQVALKLLPQHLTANAEYVQRFRQEAQAIIALNHPNILTVYDFGETDNIHYLATEYIEGQTLRQMLTRPLSLPQVLELTVQIADALIAAHQAGIIHRDLKPENVMVRHDGIVKVLDFGLAKLTGLRNADFGLRSDEDAATLVQSPADNPQSPIRIPQSTLPGTVMGTAAYMSPEQTRAQSLDQRTDIFSFGVMLYEMVTGEQPFQGANNAAILAAILHHTPTPITQLQPDLPPELPGIIARSLEKDSAHRYQTVADVKAALKSLKYDFDSGTHTSPIRVVTAPVQVPGRQGASVKIAVASIVVLALAGIASWRWFGAKPATAPKAATFTQLTRTPGQEIFPSLSPDGKLLVYASDEAGNWDIYLQRVNGTTPINLTNGSLANDTQPALSPDGEQIVFRSDRDGGGIFVMGATGENVRRLLDHGHNPAWSPDGQEIAYSDGSFARPSERGNPGSPLLVTKIANGATRTVTTTDAVHPNWSPHGDRIAYWGMQSGGQRDLWTVAAQGGEPVAVTNDAALDWNPVWSPDGRYLYFASDRGGSMNLWRVPLDEQSGQLQDAPEPVTTPATYSGYISFARDGKHLVYAQIASQSNLQQVGFDPVKAKLTGQPAWITQGSRIATDPDLSPAGEWVVFGATGDKQEDLFIVRRDGTDLRQLTNDRHKDRAPRWSPDGRQIVFFSDRSGRYQYWLIHPDGSGLRQFSELPDSGAQLPVWAADGTRLLCNLQSGPPLIVEMTKIWSQQTPLTVPLTGAPKGIVFWSWTTDGRKLAGHGGGIYTSESR